MDDRNFSVGDLVRIREWDDMADEFGIDENLGYIPCKCNFVPEMRKLCGTEFTITGFNGYIIRGLDNKRFNISTDMIEHCDECESFVFDLKSFYDGFEMR